MIDKDTKELKDIVNNILPPLDYLQALENCNNLMDLDFKIFCRLLMMLSPQKRTALLEKRLKRKFGWVTVSAHKERGDYIDPENKYFELKTSCPNSNNKILMGQVRYWQNVDYYLVLYIDCFNLENSQAFKLSKDEMIDEAFNIGCTSHKTKAASVGDQKREITLSISADPKSDDNIRWTNDYKCDILNNIFNL